MAEIIDIKCLPQERFWIVKQACDDIEALCRMHRDVARTHSQKNAINHIVRVLAETINMHLNSAKHRRIETDLTDNYPF